MALEALVNRGHSLQALLHDYPIDLVLNLHRAAMENQKMELKGQVLGFSVAVMNALDSSLNRGKGRVLKNWIKAMEVPGNERDGKGRSSASLSPQALAFFRGLPQTKKE